MHIETPSVRLLYHTPEPQKAVAVAARLCYSGASIEELQSGISGDSIARLINTCLLQGHHSVFEHSSFTFGIEGVSRAMTHQLVRHRIASYSQQSQRYVKFEDVGFIVPPEIAGDETKLSRFSESLKAAESAYRGMIKAGVAPEDARYLLPNAASSKITVTMNARQLRHFFRLRCCNRAQWEIRKVAIEMLRLSRRAAPLLFANCGPSCITGPCPEGNMTCGKIKEVRAFFAALTP